MGGCVCPSSSAVPARVWRGEAGSPGLKTGDEDPFIYGGTIIRHLCDRKGGLFSTRKEMVGWGYNGEESTDEMSRKERLLRLPSSSSRRMTRGKSLSYTLLNNVFSALCSEKILLLNNDLRSVCLVAVCKSSLSDFARIIPPFSHSHYERSRRRGGGEKRMGEDMKRGCDVFFSLRIGVALILGASAQLIPHSALLFTTVDPALGKMN